MKAEIFALILRYYWSKFNQSRNEYDGTLNPYPHCLSALNSTSIIMLAGEKGFLNVYDFNSKKWEENHPGIQEFFPLQSYYHYLFYGCSSTITFDKDGKQKLIVLISKFCFVS